MAYFRTVAVITVALSGTGAGGGGASWKTFCSVSPEWAGWRYGESSPDQSIVAAIATGKLNPLRTKAFTIAVFCVIRWGCVVLVSCNVEKISLLINFSFYLVKLRVL